MRKEKKCIFYKRKRKECGRKKVQYSYNVKKRLGVLDKRRCVIKTMKTGLKEVTVIQMSTTVLLHVALLCFVFTYLELFSLFQEKVQQQVSMSNHLCYQYCLVPHCHCLVPRYRERHLKKKPLQ